MTTGVVRSLHGLWGSAANDVWAVGDGGTILYYDGTQWTPNNQSGQLGANNLTGIFGLSKSDVWAVGDNGTLLHFDGTSWSIVNSGSVANLGAVWESADEGMVAAGQGAAILRYRSQ